LWRGIHPHHIYTSIRGKWLVEHVIPLLLQYVKLSYMILVLCLHRTGRSKPQRPNASSCNPIVPGITPVLLSHPVVLPPHQRGGCVGTRAQEEGKEKREKDMQLRVIGLYIMVEDPLDGSREEGKNEWAFVCVSDACVAAGDVCLFSMSLPCAFLMSSLHPSHRLSHASIPDTPSFP